MIHTPEHILAEMPAMPASVNQLMLALNNQNFDLTAILKQVEKEPVIAAMLIKQANSAKYKRGVKPVSDIKTAFINLTSAAHNQNCPICLFFHLSALFLLLIASY